MSESRQTALKILASALKEKSLIRIPTREDSAYLNMLLLSCLRQWADTDSILKQFLSKKLPPKAYNIELILHLAITEILSLNTPDYATINEWVDIAKKESNKVLAGLTNAILHKISQDKNNLQTQLGQHYFTPNYLSILKQDYSAKEITQMEQALIKSTEPPLCLSVKENPQLWAQKLGGEFIANDSIIIRKSGSPSKLEGYKEGAWWVQDFAASLAVTALGDIKGQRVLDLCAAPGGKTAQLINKGAKVTALDISKDRLETLKENLHRLHFEAENIVCADAIDYLQNYQGETLFSNGNFPPSSRNFTLQNARRHQKTSQSSKANFSSNCKRAQNWRNIGLLRLFLIQSRRCCTDSQFFKSPSPIQASAADSFRNRRLTMSGISLCHK